MYMAEREVQVPPPSPLDPRMEMSFLATQGFFFSNFKNKWKVRVMPIKCDSQPFTTCNYCNRFWELNLSSGSNICKMLYKWSLASEGISYLSDEFDLFDWLYTMIRLRKKNFMTLHIFFLYLFEYSRQFI